MKPRDHTLASQGESRPSSLATKIAIGYVLAGCLWIGLSDAVVHSFVSDPEYLTKIQSVKGWFYVATTGVLLYFVLRKYFALQRDANREIERLASFPTMNPTPVIEVDSSGKITFQNQAATDFVRKIAQTENANVLFPEDIQQLVQTLGSGTQSHFHREVSLGGRTFAEEIYLVPALDSLRLYAEDITERRNIECEREAQARKLATIIDAVGIGITLSDETGKFELYNTQMHAITGYSRDEANESPDFLALLYPAAEDYQNATETINDVRRRGRIHDIETMIQCKNGIRKTVLLSSLVITSGDRNMFLSSYQDITGRKRIEDSIVASLREKEVLLKEIHHRVKNNLQVISSLLSLQEEQMSDVLPAPVFRASKDRVKSMALIHENLYRSPDLARIDFNDYLHTLTSSLASSFALKPALVAIDISCHNIFLGIDTAIPCGLIVNELVSNALVHAFPNGKGGRITVRLSRSESNRLTLTVRDNGVGMPHGFDINQSRSLGLDLVQTLTRQLNGSMEFNGRGGTEVTVQFSIPARSPAV
jgi:PAS domain S-box-containing protein